MNRAIRTVLFVLIVAIYSGTLPAGGGQRTPFVLLVPKVKERVARISFSNGEFSGTGWFVSEGGKLLTCNHVLVRPDGTYDTSYVLEVTSDVYVNDTTLLRRDATTRLKAKIDTIARGFDAAILAVDLAGAGLSSIPPLPIGNSTDVREGQDVAICGFIPDVFTKPRPIISKGIVSTTRGEIYNGALGGLVDLIQLDSYISKGISGSPVFLPETGEVVGMINMGIFENDKSRQTGFAIALTINQLKPLLKSRDK